MYGTNTKHFRTFIDNYHANSRSDCFIRVSVGFQCSYGSRVNEASNTGILHLHIKQHNLNLVIIISWKKLYHDIKISIKYMVNSIKKLALIEIFIALLWLHSKMCCLHKFSPLDWHQMLHVNYCNHDNFGCNNRNMQYT